jgi:hypothetical protein
MNHINNLPYEILYHTFSYLDEETLLNARTVCKKWKPLLDELIVKNILSQNVPDEEERKKIYSEIQQAKPNILTSRRLKTRQEISKAFSIFAKKMQFQEKGKIIIYDNNKIPIEGKLRMGSNSELREAPFNLFACYKYEGNFPPQNSECNLSFGGCFPDVGYENSWEVSATGYLETDDAQQKDWTKCVEQLNDILEERVSECRPNQNDTRPNSPCS